MTNTAATQTVNAQLRSIIERIERLNEEIKDLMNDKRDVFAEARSNGFDAKAIKAVVHIRAQDPGERQEQDTIVNTYLTALGMAADFSDAVTTALSDSATPKIDQALGEAA